MLTRFEARIDPQLSANKRTRAIRELHAIRRQQGIAILTRFEARIDPQ